MKKFARDDTFVKIETVDALPAIKVQFDNKSAQKAAACALPHLFAIAIGCAITIVNSRLLENAPNSSLFIILIK